MQHPEIEGYTYIGTTVQRFVTTTDVTGTREGIIIFLKNFLGEERFNTLTEKDIDNALIEMENARKLKLAVREYVTPMLEILKTQNKKDVKKKIDELYLLGRLVQSLKKINEIKIIRDVEPPDFVVEYQNELIGMEITGCYNDEVVAEISTAKQLLDKCKIKINSENNFVRGNIQLKIIPSKLKFSKSQEEAVINEICSYIISVEQKDEFPKPDYLTYMSKEESENLDLILYEDYWLTTLTPEIVNSKIAKKENDIVKYKQKENLEKCWLLITIGGYSSKSSFDYSLLANLTVDTKFDNVFVYDVFKGKIIYSKSPVH